MILEKQIIDEIRADAETRMNGILASLAAENGLTPFTFDSFVVNTPEKMPKSKSFVVVGVADSVVDESQKQPSGDMSSRVTAQVLILAITSAGGRLTDKFLLARHAVLRFVHTARWAFELNCDVTLSTIEPFDITDNANAPYLVSGVQLSAMYAMAS